MRISGIHPHYSVFMVKQNKPFELCPGGSAATALRSEREEETSKVDIILLHEYLTVIYYYY